MLEREALFQGQVNHPLFPAYIGHGEQEGMEWILMEYVGGENMETLLRRQGCFSSRKTAEIGIKIAEGLSCLHERGRPILFRDIKPANIMLEESGRVRLMDFGCACYVGEGKALAGTPEFGAPEQFTEGRIQGVACDVYGLGQTLKRLAGKNCDRRLRRVLDRCTRQKPEERLPDMRWVIELLEACNGGKGRGFCEVQRAVLGGKILVEKNIWK